MIKDLKVSLRIVLNYNSKVIYKNYFPLFATTTYFSKAIVMEGVSGVGAKISTLNPCSSASFWVVGPKTAIRVLFCLKSGKFLNNDFIPVGLKKAKTS